ncbi:MAG: P-loop NTPase fold protein [Candidatus Gracilibacteria bacterium]|nr:P-loop NTPase fold protein [Candidatus Gracilibacteria bacterium]
MTKDLFNFRDYVLFLKDKLDNTDKSQVIGVHGDYGAGKTTTMNLIKDLYNEDLTGIDNILEFSAWRNYYNNENTVWKSLLYELSGKIYDIFEKLGEEDNKLIFSFEGIDNISNNELVEKLNENKNGFLTKIKGYLFDNKEFKKEIDSNKLIIEFVKETCKEIQYNLYQDLKDFNGELSRGESEANKFPYVTFLKSISALVTLDNSLLSDLLKKEEQNLLKPKIDSLEVIQRKFDILFEFYNLIEIKGKKIYEDINKEKSYCTIFKQKTPPLIIMIDDLDRILPEKSVEIIEILRIFFEKSKKIHFICAIDIRVIEKGIERKFNQLNHGKDLSRIEFEEYLEKIITIPFDLAAIPLVDFSENIQGIDSLIEDSIRNGNGNEKMKNKE